MRKLALAGATGFLLFFFGACATPRNAWKDVSAPTRGGPEAIGSYSAGCMRGAQSLYPDGKGYRVMRITRRRFYGHPNLVRFIENWSERFAKKKRGTLLIGDLAMPRGGPFLSGHASHQSGLDVDIWYLQLPDATTPLTLDMRETLSSPSVVSSDGKSLIESVWTDEMSDALELAASDPEVERIFVHSAVKRSLCNKVAGKLWLRKIRPWWGHDDHFHVRLRCPVGEAGCVPQVAPVTDECEREFEKDFERVPGESVEPSGLKRPKLPEACSAVLSEQS